MYYGALGAWSVFHGCSSFDHTAQHHITDKALFPFSFIAWASLLSTLLLSASDILPLLVLSLPLISESLWRFGCVRCARKQQQQQPVGHLIAAYGEGCAWLCYTVLCPHCCLRSQIWLGVICMTTNVAVGCFELTASEGSSFIPAHCELHL